METKIKTEFDKTFKNYSSNDELNFKKNNLENFIKNGFPGRKLESWKFSDLNQIINTNIGELNFFTDLKNISFQVNEGEFKVMSLS